MFRTFVAPAALLILTTAPAMAVEAPSFYPVKPWVSAGSSVDGCTMATEYNNGFIVQMKTMQDTGVSISFNTRQNAFDVGQSYDAVITSSGQPLTKTMAKAIDPQTASIPVTQGDRLFNAMVAGETYAISLEENTFRFEPANLGQAGQSFGDCLRAHNAANAAKTIQPVKAEPVFVPETTDTMTYTDMGGDKSNLSHIGITPDTPVNVSRESYTAKADFTGDSFAQSELERENQQLREELAMALSEGRKEDMTIHGNNWDLERATLMLNESERQVQILGQKLKRQELKCQADTRELETMLFDPRVTNEQQMARLATLEAQLADAQEQLQLQRMRYDEKIRLLESRLGQ